MTYDKDNPPPPQLSEEQKQLFKDMAARRKAKGIQLGRWSIMVEKSALETIHEFWESWVRVFGKEKAVDNLIEAMMNQHELIRQRLIYERDSKRGKRL